MDKICKSYIWSQTRERAEGGDKRLAAANDRGAAPLSNQGRLAEAELRFCEVHAVRKRVIGDTSRPQAAASSVL